MRHPGQYFLLGGSWSDFWLGCVVKLGSFRYSFGGVNVASFYFKVSFFLAYPLS